jgi:micrococcal nuclease
MFGRLLRALLRPPARTHTSSNLYRPAVTPAHRRQPVKPYEGPKRRPIAQPAPFDPNEARPPKTRTVISGAAYVVDGDTITLRKTQIRLFGIDAPEMDHPFGRKAKSALIDICKGRTVHAEILEEDDHGRTVAICRLDDGRDLSAEMVKLGLAIDWPKYSDGAYKEYETDDARKRLWLADARQKGRMYLWYRYDVENGRDVGADDAPSSEPQAEVAATVTAGCVCPRCGAAMVKRPNRRTGVEFWGCSTFPACRGSRSVS